MSERMKSANSTKGMRAHTLSGAYRKMAVIIIISILIVSVLYVFPSRATEPEKDEPLIAYRAEIIPNIDGKLSPDEWYDAQPYSYRAAFLPKFPFYNISFCLKHDDRRLYILLISDDEDIYEKNSLIITYGSGNPGLILSSDGKIYEIEFYVQSWGNVVVYPVSNISAEVSHNYAHGIHIFEAWIGLRYIETSNGTVQPFNIGYVHYEPVNGSSSAFSWFTYQIITVGDNLTKPGLILSEKYYMGSENIYGVVEEVYNVHIPATQNITFLIVAAVVGIFAISGVIFWILRYRKKNSRTLEMENPKEE